MNYARRTRRNTTWPLALLFLLIAFAPGAAGQEDGTAATSGDQEEEAPAEGVEKYPAEKLEEQGLKPLMEYASDDTVGIDERLGEIVPLDLTFRDEMGIPVTLGELIERPTMLMLVYLRCKSICSPLMHEVKDVVDKLEMEAGIDFDIITVSFDITDTPELANRAKTNLLGQMKKKVPPESWHFLTGDVGPITELTRSVGFLYKKDDQEFVHAASLIFLSPEGKIVRYLGGLRLLPADVELAVIDAAEGRPRSFMQKLQRLCYAYDPEGKTYMFQVNRIVLAVTLLLVAVFLGFILLKKAKKKTGKESAS